MNRLACLLFAIALSFFSGARACNKNDAPREDLKLTADEQAVVDLTNAERKKADLQPLKPNPQLMEAARGHAQNMAKQDKLEHVLDDKTPADRTKAAGYKSGTIGENIAWNQKKREGRRRRVDGLGNAPRQHFEEGLHRDRSCCSEEREGGTVLGAGVREAVRT
ncbi:Putative uncharacterized protein OS=Arthrospira sp. PCC 8005 GN=ARTHRO_300014 PE=4 SV=1: CAP [Gemmata massiliana]|uniref:SCP domain-containing protein n=1 Tax=Gemmata massiliana TaxID=1210884 RepID=A0A6P2CPY4_9BACT|nr:Putative uncharacterized protein OS=Arthrospira sp. PCC 8005 GN=ARTHRO_300014 PE=4 SV=1: CAP [Gemmata massiliana]